MLSHNVTVTSVVWFSNNASYKTPVEYELLPNSETAHYPESVVYLILSPD